MKEYTYEICCINADGEDIQNLREVAKKVTYYTFIKHVDYKVLNEMFPKFYLRYDWHVTYHRSIYQGRLCYYLMHSGIEYIFTKEKESGC